MFDLVSKWSKDKETEITTEEPKKPKKKNKNNLKQEKK
jgi:hypothetical protein